jgi:uncharacterized protein involved in type VI secretion and phage assembly
VIVRSWDPRTKKEIVGQASTPQDTPRVGEQGNGGQVAQRAFNVTSKEIVVDRPVATQAEADEMAQSICDEIGNAFIQAEGICEGNPLVHAGAIVEVKGVGQRFSGRYRITHAVHRYDDSGYTTHFTVSGRRSNTLGALLASKNNGKGNVVVGIVTNNNDPDGWGRVKVKLPTMPGNDESNWARLVTPMAGNGMGIQFIPEVNDEVLVTFEYGDINRPFVIGSLWNGKDKPPEGNGDVVSSTGKVEKRIIRSRSGHTILLDDSDGKENISIVDKTKKNTFQIDSKSNSVLIKTQGGHQIVLDGSSGQEKIDIIDKTGKNSVKIDSMQNSISVESGMQLKLKAQNIEIDAGASMKIKAGASMNVECAMTTVKGSGVLTLEGGLVKIN